MRVYVESNFVVELSLRQEEVDACEEILALAVSRRVELVVPMIALLEPSETLRRRQAVMSDFATRLGENLRELERISLAGVAKGANQHLVKGFRDAINDWKPRLSAVRQSIARVARVLPLDVDLMDRAETLVFDGLMEKEPDALVLAAVIRDLTQHPAPALFVNRNTRDFDDHKSGLKSLGCDLLGTFSHALSRLRKLSPSP